MNASSMRRSRSLCYADVVSRMVVRAARHADDPGLIRINARSACAQGQPSRASQCGITRRTYRNVHPSRSRHLGDARAAIRPGLCAGDATSAARKTRPGRAPAPPPAKPATTGAATAPQLAKTNLNTATAAELDKLPQIGPARSKAIIEARAKAKFKNWDDFVARKVVPADAAAAIKDVVSF